MLEFLKRILANLAWPVLKQLIVFLLRMVEVKFPGLAVFIEAIIDYLNSGGSAHALREHCEAFPGFCAVQK